MDYNGCAFVSQSNIMQNDLLVYFRTGLQAVVILLPLLGITWVFGLLAVSQNTSVFAWLFTILNSLQVNYSCTIIIVVSYFSLFSSRD